MATELKRMTFAVTPEMEPMMDKAKKLFYNRTQSEMIRALIIAGLDTLDGGYSEQARMASEIQLAGKSQ